ncbi:MAG: hypothetical protein GX647_00465 [Clostridiales bacterium]|jgi:hypothetical protein|nr:hypothetical protein [Clostridiales bacterium]
MWVLFAILAVVAAASVFLSIPYSPTAARFHRLAAEKIASAGVAEGMFSEGDIAGLPAPVQRYFRYCGYLGTPKMAYMRASFEGVDFLMDGGKALQIDYRQLNLTARPERFALIRSSLYGIPFEGLDSYEAGVGSMRGALAKVIPLFDQRGESMDRASLVTWLAECLLAPSAALQDFVRWEAVDETHAKASATWENCAVSGTFAFSESGELLSFRTSDRVAVAMDGAETRADWSALFGDYRSANGVLQPRVMQSVWHYEEGDSIYFNRNAAEVAIRYQ